MSKQVEQALASFVDPKVRDYIKSIIEPAFAQMNARIEAQADVIIEMENKLQKHTSTNSASIADMKKMMGIFPKNRAAVKDLMDLIESKQ